MSYRPKVVGVKTDSRVIYFVLPFTPEQLARFDHQRGNLSRAEYLDELMDLIDGGSDFAEMPY